MKVLGAIIDSYKTRDIFSVFEDPIRSEKFSAASLERHGMSLAQAQDVFATTRRGVNLAARVADNENVLTKAYKLIMETVHEQRAITPAAEWLIDNFYIVEEQLRDIRDHLPPSYYRELPKLASGHLVGHPRIYGIAWAYVAHNESLFDAELLKRFVKSYQKVQPLTIGELWALSIILRVVMIENLRRICARIVGQQIARKKADLIADELLGLTPNSRTTEEILANLRKEIKRKIVKKKKKSLQPGFAVQLIQRLRFQEAKVAPILAWLDENLAISGLLADEIVPEEHSSQTIANATVRNIITSMRMMSAYDWHTFFEEISLVNEIFCKSQHYSEMDFITRDRYRHGLEELARGSKISEIELAHAVFNMAEENKVDIGFYLISAGRYEFEKAIGFKVSLRRLLLRWYVLHAEMIYFGSIIFLTLLFLFLCFNFTNVISSMLVSILLLFLAIFPALDVAITVINRLTMAILVPRHLPRLKLSLGVPSHLKTFIVVPTMLGNQADVANQIEQLEVHFLTNPDGAIYLALLSDWNDSQSEHEVTDWPILRSAIKKINELNEKYGPTTDNKKRFFIFHRKRKWNESEQKWIGWERKRGKLSEFNRLLRSGGTWPIDSSFITDSIDIADLPVDIRYVITLDADTKMPKGAVTQLVGTFAHPLNQPRFDHVKNRVVEGYGILQPRITASLPATKDSTLFQRLSAGQCGIDPYSSAVSDLYQDLFGEGSYTGKGIYNVDLFERALYGRVPQNRLLSHDLFEGNFVRCGLLSDVEFFEDFPSHIEVSLARIHRWTRGDWQLLPWILGRCGSAISLVGRFKMIDNLRRSLTPPMTLFLFITLFLTPGLEIGAFVVLNLVSLGLPALLPFLSEIISYKRRVSVGRQIRSLAEDLFLGVGRFFLNIILLPHQSRIFLDAIFRALFRLLISKRNLLEWMTAATTKSASNTSFKSFASGISCIETSLVLILLPLIFFFNQTQIITGTIFIFLWSIYPLVAWHISRPPPIQKIMPLSQDDVFILRSSARRIWRFFTTFVTEQDSFLPPDNFQETPQPVLAHRSSPTNFGLYLLSIISAHDFGWISIQEMIERLTNTLNSIKKLPRHRGHFFNWYRTTDGNALLPLYISSVDNGNFAGHLLTLAQSLEGISLSQQLSTDTPHIAKDSLRLLREAIFLSERTDEKRNLLVNQSQIIAATNELENLLLLGDLDLIHLKAVTVVDLAKTFADERGEVMHSEVLNWSKEIESEIASHKRDHASCDPESINITQQKARDLARCCRELFNEMDFNLLYDHSRKLFSIGFRLSDSALDNSYYDLLASEARLLSFIAIAKGDISSKHWFRLGRALAPVGNGAALISWSGSMFEYLMPSLVMNNPLGSLLEQTCKLVVKRQILYAKEREVPWGISESAYNVRDLHFIYQYSNFGVPGLGLKRGLASDLVVAPYATILAAMYDPISAVKNLQLLTNLGANGILGFYDAIDFTRERLQDGQTYAIVQTYMTHHQAMSLVAIANVLYDGIFRKRFHQSPIIQASELLLQERTPRNVAVEEPQGNSLEAASVVDSQTAVARRYYGAGHAVPRTHILSNGNYAVMMNTAGSGFSRFRDLDVTRWRQDVTRDHYGSYIFLRMTGGSIEQSGSAKIWSAGYRPTNVDADQYEVIFTEDRVKIVRKDGAITSQLEIFVSPEDNTEIRRLYLTNNSLEPVEIEVTSYAEIVLNTHAADIAHPAFSSLFIQTEYIEEMCAIIATRRPRSQNDPTVWLAHVITTDTSAIGGIEYESDRARFIGRGRTISNPISIFDGKPLSNTAGSVLDPIMALRTRVRIAPRAMSQVTYSTAITSTREEILNLADKLRDDSTFERVSSLAWTQAQVTLHYLGIEHSEAHLFQELATRTLYLDSSLRSSSEILKRNDQNISALWAHGISGDHPIILIKIDDEEDLAIIRQILRAREYWGTKRLVVDIVILNEKLSSYSQQLHDSLETMVHGSMITSGSYLPQNAGAVFVLRSPIISPDAYDLLQVAACAILVAKQGSLAEQVKRTNIIKTWSNSLNMAIFKPARSSEFNIAIPALDFFNGLGGFADQGKEYVIHLRKGQCTPAPWINVIANRTFGFQVSESGAGYSWSLNSRENQITPWSNDPVSDPSGEFFYIFDKDSKNLWGPTTWPIRVDDAEYVIHHGQGYSRFELINQQIYSDLTQFVDWNNPVKISKLTVKNLSNRVRHISIIGYIEWVLGFSRATTAPFIITQLDEITAAVFAHNPWNQDFGKRVTFATFLGGNDFITCDRTQFIGRNGNYDQPFTIFNNNFNSNENRNYYGAGVDPCAAIFKDLTIRPNKSVTVVFLLGQADNHEQARAIVKKMQSTPSTLSFERIDNSFQEVVSQWNNLLTKIQVDTPDLSMNIMLNRWSLYQTTVCRLFTRSAFYQAGGAYGFRDQLQDSLALIWADPSLTKTHILRACSRQFTEGDVQHWWHHPQGRGVRTRCSDDLLWLPFAVSYYLKISKDYSILDEDVSFLDGPLLTPDQEDAFYTPNVSKEKASVYEHCARAIDKSLNVGAHGLPLVGSGDWNDGMNRIGVEGKGESVWLAWFLYMNLIEFAKIAESRRTKDDAQNSRANIWREHADKLKIAIEKEAWDGAWYRRAFFDDGTPLGSVSNLECRIDSIAQTWSIISGAAEESGTSEQTKERAARAMESVEEYLIKTADDLVLIFTPPFDKTMRDPGYIKGYLPGVRENGGHYSHAAAWCIYAYAGLGKGQNAVEIFSMLNPINRSSTRAKVHRYKVEPYVLAADIYSEPPYVGRGGWTWYTGSAALFYRAGIEAILGFKLSGNELTIDPTIHPEWKSYKIFYRYQQTNYTIEVKNNRKSNFKNESPAVIVLINDCIDHYISLDI